MTRSLRKSHLAALAGIIVCVVVVVACGSLLFSHLPPFSMTDYAYVAIVFTALAGIIGLGVWLFLITVPTVRHDIYTLVRMFKDVRQGAVRVAYPIMLTEFAAAHRYLRSWGMEMVAEKERLKGMGLIDHLSQLSNRRHFELRLKELFDSSRTHGTSSVLIIDIDYFKQVNDKHGHDAGDALIVQFAALLRTNVRHTDVLARLGGDEFCIIYTYVPLNKAQELVERLRRALPREVELKPDVRHGLRWTGGLSAFHDADLKPDDVLRRADQALFRAKEDGRHRTVIYDPDIGLPTAPPPAAPVITG